MRHSAGRLDGEGYGEERLIQWMYHWAKVRHEEAAERTLLTAVGCGVSKEALGRMVFGPMQERIYADGGHALDLCNKGFELLEFIGWEYATEILPLIVQHVTESQSEEEQGAWRGLQRALPSAGTGRDSAGARPRPIPRALVHLFRS